MYYYELLKRETGDVHICESPKFKSLIGFGFNADDAFSNFVEKLYELINDRIANSEEYPEPLSEAEFNQLKQSGNPHYFFIVSPSKALKMLLHKTMLEVGVTRAELAKLFKLTGEEVSPTEWHLPNTKKLSTNKNPDYKKVHRLLDLHHKSSIYEIEEAFRLLGKDLDFFTRDKDVV